MLNVNEVAQLAHEVNRAYCESIGDMSQPCVGQRAGLAEEERRQRRDCAPEQRSHARAIARELAHGETEAKAGYTAT
jgi:hypothetical protein